MKFIKYTLLICILVLISSSIYSCSNARISAGMGVDVHFGPHGPRVDPHLNLNVYNGGRF